MRNKGFSPKNIGLKSYKYRRALYPSAEADGNGNKILFFLYPPKL